MSKDVFCTQCLLPIRMYYFNELVNLNIHACGNRRCGKFKETLFYTKVDESPSEPNTCVACEG